MRHHFSNYKITLHEPTDENADSSLDEKRLMTYIVFKVRNTTWKVPIAFFIAPEVQELIRRAELLKPLETAWQLAIPEKNRTLDGSGITQLNQALSAISKPYMSIQRYKGLGEMNADQLWETSMEVKTRSILKVSIEDALEADRWFTTLMGDDVQGRREYIEQFGQFVKNLDV